MDQQHATPQQRPPEPSGSGSDQAEALELGGYGNDFLQEELRAGGGPLLAAGSGNSDQLGYLEQAGVLSEVEPGLAGPSAEGLLQGNALEEAIADGVELKKGIDFERTVNVGFAEIKIAFAGDFRLWPRPSLDPETAELSMSFGEEHFELFDGIEEVAGGGFELKLDFDEPFLLSEAGFDLPFVAAKLDTEEGKGGVMIGIDDCNAGFSVGKASALGVRPISIQCMVDPFALACAPAKKAFLDSLKEHGIELDFGSPFELELALGEDLTLKLERIKAELSAEAAFGGAPSSGGGGDEGGKLGVRIGGGLSVETDFGGSDPAVADLTETTGTAKLFVGVKLAGNTFKWPIVDLEAIRSITAEEDREMMTFFRESAVEAGLLDGAAAFHGGERDRLRLMDIVNQKIETYWLSAWEQLQQQAGSDLVQWRYREPYVVGQGNTVRWDGLEPEIGAVIRRSASACSVHDCLLGNVTDASPAGAWRSSSVHLPSLEIEAHEPGEACFGSWAHGALRGELSGGYFSGTFDDDRYGEGRAEFHLQQRGARMLLVLQTEAFTWSITFNRA